jgi:hypothetical protein
MRSSYRASFSSPPSTEAVRDDGIRRRGGGLIILIDLVSLVVLIRLNALAALRPFERALAWSARDLERFQRPHGSPSKFKKGIAIDCVASVCIAMLHG